MSECSALLDTEAGMCTHMMVIRGRNENVFFFSKEKKLKKKEIYN